MAFGINGFSKAINASRPAKTVKKAAKAFEPARAEEKTEASRTNTVRPAGSRAAAERLNAPKSPEVDSPYAGPTARGTWATAFQARRAEPEEALELSDEAANADVMDRYFGVFDDRGGDDTDGVISSEDMEAVASGDFDREAAEQRLRDQGVSRRDVDDVLDEIEDAAEYYQDHQRALDEVDGANDDGDTDGRIRRGDVDRMMLDLHEQRLETATSNAGELSEAEREDFQRAYANPEALARVDDLGDFSSGELLALAQLQADGDAPAQLDSAVSEALASADSLADLPQNAGFSALLGSNMTDENAERVQSLVREDLDRRLDGYLEDRRGDSEADLAVERLVGDVEMLAVSNPALGEALVAEAEAVLAERAGDLSGVRRADDSTLSRVNHAVTGALTGAAGFLGDRLRDIGDIAGQYMTAPLRVAGEALDFVATNAGRVGGLALDAVGAEGLAEDVRNGAERAGEFANGATDWLARQQRNSLNGFAEGAAGTIEGSAALVSNPVGTVQGLAAIARDPGLIVDNYAQIVEEHGYAGLAGNIGFDVLSAIATGGGSAAGVTRLAGLADNVAGAGRLGSAAARTLNVAGDALRAVDLPNLRLRDNLPELATAAQRLPGIGNPLASGLARAENYVPNAPFNRNRQALPNLGQAAGRGASDADGLVAMGREALGDRADGVSREQLLREGALAEARRLDASFGEASVLDNATISPAFAPIVGRENVLQHLFENWDSFEHARGLDQVTLARNVLRDAGDGQVVLARLASDGPNPSVVHRAFDRSSVNGDNAEALGLSGSGQRRALNATLADSPFWASDRYGAYYGFADDYTRIDPVTGLRVMDATSGELRAGQAAPLQNRTNVGELSVPDRDALVIISRTAPNQIGGRFGLGGMTQIRPVEALNWVSQGRLDPLGDFALPNPALFAATHQWHAGEQQQVELDWLTI